MDLIELAKRRGFFWPSSLIHGSLAGFYDYGHVGTLVKRKWEDLWRGFFLRLGESFYEISPSVIMPEQVFKASGHLESFVDPIVKCKKCGNVERADHILEDLLKENFEGLSTTELDSIIRKHNIKCEKCSGPLEEVAEINMTFPLKVGTGNEARNAYLTPETAQGAYVDFKQMFEVLRKKLPMGLAVVGKAFRNEISPRNALIRMREFSQAELQVFFDPQEIGKHSRFKEVESHKLRVFPVKERKENKTKEMTCKELAKTLPEFYVYHLAKVQEFYLEAVGIPKEKFRLKELSQEEKAFYNKFHWDAELELSLGWKEVGGVHYRADHDLSRHEKVSGESMSVTLEDRKFIPHVLEISMGVDRNIFALLDIFAREEKERTVLGFPRHLSPFDAAVFPLVNKGGLPEKACEVKTLLEKEGFTTFFDSSGSIGRMYRRMDEIGGVACITIDYDSLTQEDVTLRDRDSMKQIRVKIKDLPQVLTCFLQGEKLGKLGKIIN